MKMMSNNTNKGTIGNTNSKVCKSCGIPIYHVYGQILNVNDSHLNESTFNTEFQDNNIIEEEKVVYLHEKCNEWFGITNHELNYHNSEIINIILKNNKSKKCIFCSSIGPIIKCSFNNCTNFFHLHCYSLMNRCFVDFNSKIILCPYHSHVFTRQFKNKNKCNICSKDHIFNEMIICNCCFTVGAIGCLCISENKEQIDEGKLFLKLDWWFCSNCRFCKICNNKISLIENPLRCVYCKDYYHLSCIENSLFYDKELEICSGCLLAIKTNNESYEIIVKRNIEIMEYRKNTAFFSNAYAILKNEEITSNQDNGYKKIKKSPKINKNGLFKDQNNELRNIITTYKKVKEPFQDHTFSIIPVYIPCKLTEIYNKANRIDIKFMENFSTKRPIFIDEYTGFFYDRDICSSCGSLGKDREGDLISCSICADCFHPFCIDFKMTEHSKLHGWRCMDCIVCEICMGGDFEDKLMICNECDLSFHTFCLNPPINEIPSTIWICANCLKPEKHSIYDEKCNACNKYFKTNEFLVKCTECSKCWMHGRCVNITVIEENKIKNDENFELDKKIFCKQCLIADKKLTNIGDNSNILYFDHTNQYHKISTEHLDQLYYNKNQIFEYQYNLSDNGVKRIRCISSKKLNRRKKKANHNTQIESSIDFKFNKQQLTENFFGDRIHDSISNLSSIPELKMDFTKKEMIVDNSNNQVNSILQHSEVKDNFIGTIKNPDVTMVQTIDRKNDLYFTEYGKNRENNKLNDHEDTTKIGNLGNDYESKCSNVVHGRNMINGSHLSSKFSPNHKFDYINNIYCANNNKSENFNVNYIQNSNTFNYISSNTPNLLLQEAEFMYQKILNDYMIKFTNLQENYVRIIQSVHNVDQQLSFQAHFRNQLAMATNEFSLNQKKLLEWYQNVTKYSSTYQAKTENSPNYISPNMWIPLKTLILPITFTLNNIPIEMSIPDVIETNLENNNSYIKKEISENDETLPKIKCSNRLVYKNWFPVDVDNLNIAKPVLIQTGIPSETNDQRNCILCKIEEESLTNKCGRLLYIDYNRWIHFNCALWSSLIKEYECGYISNIKQAIELSKITVCTICNKKGASIYCFEKSCQNVYHFNCAISTKVTFIELSCHRFVYCTLHSSIDKISKMNPDNYILNQLDCYRRLIILPTKNVMEDFIWHFKKQQTTMDNSTDKSLHILLRIGLLTIKILCRLKPSIESFYYSSLNNILTEYLKINYRFWNIFSTSPTIRSTFNLSIKKQMKNSAHFFKFKSSCLLNSKFDFTTFKNICSDLNIQLNIVENKNIIQLLTTKLDDILECISRHKNTMLPNKYKTLRTSLKNLGLDNIYLISLIESLPLKNMMNIYRRYELTKTLADHIPIAPNISGCIRSEEVERKNGSKFQDIDSHKKTLASLTLNSHFKSLNNHNSISNQEIATGESKSTTLKNTVDKLVDNSDTIQKLSINSYCRPSQLRKLRTEWKYNIVIKKSTIQGYGLFASKDFDSNAMVIEYIGQSIRNEVANRLEKVYEKKNKGTYMFRIDSEFIIDATNTGGPARYINHCCDPNCFAEVVDIGECKSIVIITKRKIKLGEELTYDYQFEFEDDNSKIPCLCGADKCRKWIN